MFKIQSTKQFAAAIVASGCLVLALGAHADPVGGTEPGARSMQTESAACKSARASAWFERQRARTPTPSVAPSLARVRCKRNRRRARARERPHGSSASGRARTATSIRRSRPHVNA